MTSHDPIDLALSAVLATRHRIQFGLRHNHLLVGPAHGDELTDEWHLQFAVHFLVLFLVRMLGKPAAEGVDEREVAVHVLIFNERPTHDYMRNQVQWHDVGRRLRIVYESGYHLADGNITYRRLK